MILSRVLRRNTGQQVVGLLFCLGLPFASVTGALSLGGPGWTDMAPDTAPSVGGLSKMAYDAESDRIILFGGQPFYTGPGSSQTWAYDYNSNTWTNMDPATKPSPRSDHAMAYDAESDRVIIFGGWDAGQKSDTWAYDFNSNAWTNMNPAASPPKGSAQNMAYDAESDRIILFGGWTKNDTWTYDFNANTWTNMNPATTPQARPYFAMAYDAESDRVIIFGGGTDISGFRISSSLQDTWAYDFNSNTWTNMEPTTMPFPRAFGAMIYAAEVERILLFGGRQNRTILEISGDDDTWAYDYNTNTWTAMNTVTHPSRRYMHAMAYDAESARIILYGGEGYIRDDQDTYIIDHKNDTWAYAYPTTSEVEVREISLGVPTLWGLVMGVVTLVVFRRRSR